MSVEVMTGATVPENSFLSVMTVALLKDTGYWDDVNENMANPWYWGKNKGWEFVEGACTPKFAPEVLPKDTMDCTV